MINLSDIVQDLQSVYKIYTEMYNGINDINGKALTAAYVDGIRDGLDLAIEIIKKGAIKKGANDEKKDT